MGSQCMSFNGCICAAASHEVMGSRKGGKKWERGENVYDLWSGVSGVPGLGKSSLQKSASENSHRDWTYGRTKEYFPTDIYHGIPKANLRSKSYQTSKALSTNSLVIPKLSCHNCGYTDSFLNSFKAPYADNHSDSYESISSTDSIASPSEERSQYETKQTQLQYSRSLNCLPNPDKYPAPNIHTNHSNHPNTPYKNTTISIKPTHKKLERAKGAKVLRPRVTFSEFTENIDVIGKEHKKLARKENIFEVEESPESILIGGSKHTTNELANIETESEEEDEYSYVYRDAFSPAVLIKLAEDNESESEDIYELIENPNEEKATATGIFASDNPSEQENPFFLSISKGRRNHLKLHRLVDWDFEAEHFGVQRNFQIDENAQRKILPQVKEEEYIDKYHQTYLSHKEKERYFKEGVNKKSEKVPPERQLMINESEVKYFKYKNYKNVRSRKIKKMIKREASQVNSRGQAKDHLKVKQSISKKMSSISFFTQNKENKSNFRKTLKRKLSTMVVSM